MSSKILIPIVGIHSAGKSTIRKELDNRGYVTEEECAEIIRVSSNITAGAGAEASFEDLVQSAEMQRDLERKWDSPMIIVESWHILTLAYRLTRRQSFFSMKNYFEYTKKQAKNYDIHCIFLQSDPFKILERSRKLHSEDDIDKYYEFYQKLEKNIAFIIEALGFDYKTFNTMKPLNATVEEILEFLQVIQEDK